jgi:hypothetical protein
VVSFTPRPFYPEGKSPWYPLDRRLGGPQSRSGHGGVEENLVDEVALGEINVGVTFFSPSSILLIYHSP